MNESNQHPYLRREGLDILRLKNPHSGENIAHLYHCINYGTCFIIMVKPLIDVALYSYKLSQRTFGIYYCGQYMFYFIISSVWTRFTLHSYSYMKENLLKHGS
eukprot:UN00998